MFLNCGLLTNSKFGLMRYPIFLRAGNCNRSWHIAPIVVAVANTIPDLSLFARQIAIITTIDKIIGDKLGSMKRWCVTNRP